MKKHIRNLARRLFHLFPNSVRQSYHFYLDSHFPLMTYLRNADEVELIALLPHRPRTIVDIGANHGDWTWGLLKLLGADATFHLFEPTPALVQELKRRFAPYPNVYVYDLAVSDKAGTAEFHLYDSDVFSSLESLDRILVPHAGEETRTEVITDSLDNVHRTLLKGVDIDLLKIDTQGHEEAIIDAAVAALSATSAILVEWSLISVYQNGSDFISLHRCLTNKGFRLAYIPAQFRNGLQLTWGDALYINSKHLDA